FIKKAIRKRSFIARKPNVMICVPSGITMVEERDIIDASKQMGAKEAYLIPEPLSAPIRTRNPVWDPTGSIVCDIGCGTTEVAIISLGGIVTSRSIRTGGDNMDEAIIQNVRKHYNLMIGERSAETIKLDIGIAGEVTEDIKIDIRGR